MGPDLMINFRKQTEKMGTTIIDDEVVNVNFKHKPFKILTASEEYEANAVIICTGANPRKLGLEGEKTYAGKGVSYCATCDGPFFRNQELVVAGGGDSAIETPDLSGGMEPVPGAVDALQEDSFATAGDSGLNMVRKIMRRNK